MLKYIKALLCIMTAAFLAGCNYAPANQSVIYTEDCGKSWKLVKTGERIPITTAQVCTYTVTMPDYPMQGDTSFLTQFDSNVLVRVELSYDYQISDPLRYIENAKFLGRINNGESGGGQADSGKYETAENVVIDTRLREIVTASTGGHDIVNFNPSAFEDMLFNQAQKVLAERGVSINSMTFVILPDEQTRTAIDAATAMAIYESRGIGKLGERVIEAKAGATRVEVNNVSEKPSN